jgi:hypothetical protein
VGTGYGMDAFLCFLRAGNINLFQRIRKYACQKAPQSVSVVIPTRNEAEHISACIHAILKDKSVGGVFNDSGWRMRLIEFLNDFRFVFTGIGFGDQVQFFRRKPVLERNLFPIIPLMEDVEFSLRLKRLGRQA